MRVMTLLLFLILVALIAASGAVFKPGVWYTTLNKPVWTPPNWLFPVAWTLLYSLIAVSGWLAWHASPAGRGRAFFWYGLQLLLNAAWSWLFFGLQEPVYGLINISLMLIVISINMIIFWQRRRLAGLLLVPYLLWVLYAAGLNAAIVWMNPVYG